MLNKLNIEQTKSRSRHSNDNALAESKNASVVRKHMGYSHIPQKYAKPINAFYENTFNSWLNLTRLLPRLLCSISSVPFQSKSM